MNDQSLSASRMSAIDAAFLYLERGDLPLNIASVCIFDGPVDVPRFLAGMKARLHLVPKYRQIPLMPAWNLTFPTWQDDPHFDLKRHIVRTTLDAPGDDAALEALAGRILSSVFDRSHPLWEVHVVDGLSGGRGALIWRVHHALADGVSGTELLKTFLDTTPEGGVTRGRRRRKVSPATETRASLVEEIAGAVSQAVTGMLEVETGLLALGQHLIEGVRPASIQNLAQLVPEYSVAIERLPFNKPCTGARKFCWTEWSLAEVQAIREAAGGTLNDVVLAALTRALARYVKSHGQSVVNRFVRIVCPVNLRPLEQNNGIGNQISFLPVALPLDARGPLPMLREVTRRTETLKHCGALGFVGLAAKWFSVTPAPLQAFFWKNIPDVILPVPLLNMICTNVAGPATPLYAAGRKTIAAYPQVPTGWDLGVGCAVHSYDGKLFFGFIADTDAAPDVERLRDALAWSFDELRKAVSRKAARPRKQSRGARAAGANRAAASVAVPAPAAIKPKADAAPGAEPVAAGTVEAA